MGAKGFWRGRQRLRCGGVLGAGGCPTECGQFWYQRGDQNQGWATESIPGADVTPDLGHMLRGGVRAGFGTPSMCFDWDIVEGGQDEKC